MIRAIAFDLFDTLVDHNPAQLPSIEVNGRRLSPTAEALYRTLIEATGIGLSLIEYADLQREVDRELFRETLALGIELPTARRFESLLDRLGRPQDATLVESMTDAHMRILREAVTVPAHHEAVLASLAIDYSLVLCSNFSHAVTARRIIDEAGFTRHFSSLVISDEVGIRKPRREIFEEVANRLSMEPREILHVGDNLAADVGGAARVGMRTVWLTRRIADPERDLQDFDGPRPDFALEDLMDLPVLAARLTVGRGARAEE